MNVMIMNDLKIQLRVMMIWKVITKSLIDWYYGGDN